MPHTAMEYAIMIPLLILQVLLLPLSTTWIMGIWTDSRMNLELQEVANHMGSAIQQLYFSFNSKDVLPGLVTDKPDVPPFIESYSYYATGTLRSVSQTNSSKVLGLRFALRGKSITANSSVTFGPNVQWQSSTFVSNSSASSIRIQKLPNGTDQWYFILSFG